MTFRQLLRLHGIRQSSELAKRVGISRQQAYQLWQGKRVLSRQMIARISEAIGIAPVDLFLAERPMPWAQPKGRPRKASPPPEAEGPKPPAKPPARDWTDLYQTELGVDPHDKQELLDAVSRDLSAASRGDKAAKRRVAAYNRAQRAFHREVAAEERAAARMAREDGEVLPVDPWAADAEDEDDEEGTDA